MQFSPGSAGAGTYIIEYSYTDGNNCTGIAQQQVTVYPSPTANAGLDDSIQQGGSTSLSGSGGISCTWSPSTGLNNTGSCNPIASPAQTTTYTLTVTDGNGCTDTDIVVVTVDPTDDCSNSTITVNPNPIPLSAGSGTGVGSVTFTPSGTNCTWSVQQGDCSWISGLLPSGDQTGDNNIIFNVGLNNSGVTRTCTLIITYDGGTETVDVEQLPIDPTEPCDANPLSIPVVGLNGCELSTSQVPGVSYQWYVSGSAVGNGTRFHQVAQAGTYYLVITDGDSCTAQSADCFINFDNGICTGSPECPLGIEEQESMNMSVIPNPNSGNFELVISGFSGLQHYDVVSSLGQLIRSGAITSERTAIDLQGTAAGIYSLRVLDNSGQSIGVRRFVVME